jgi:RNA polymerase sigma factor (sigma-70 family)
MATSPMSEILQHLHRAVRPPDGAGRTDGQLLEDFVTARDEAAFAALLRRHAPMVWGVCRRLLACPQDAEDAFQATFLVLVRKAAAVVPREMVANWLYGVAHQTALNARAHAARRRACERQVAHMPETAAPQRDLWRDLQAVLDLELSRLPDKYRAAIVLCDLEGKSRKEAAAQLGVPEGTLSGWLTRGRAMLARRLARHGLAVSGTALAAVLSQNAASAAVPASAVSATIRAASLLTGGQALAAGAVSAQAAALAEGVVKTMLLTKLKITTAVVLIVSLAGMGATGLIYQAHAAQQAQPSVLQPRTQENEERKPTKGAARQGPGKPKFTLDKETTHVTGPLDKDGYVDYETALNERLRQGITPQKNANVLLWKALGPHPDRVTMPGEYFRWLGIPAPPETGEYFIGIGRYATEGLKLKPGEQVNELLGQYDRAARRPWVEKDYPQIAGWLKANEKPLAVVLEATRRPDYYNPLVSRKTGEEGRYGLIGGLLPNVQMDRALATALAARAMLHAGQGKNDMAWQELLTCHHLGRLAARGSSLVEFLVGLGIVRLACEAELALLEKANPTALQARAWLRDLQHLPPIPPIADRVDLLERFLFLDSVMLARRNPSTMLRLLEGLEKEGRSPPRAAGAQPPQAVLDALDWDSILRSGNAWYDRTAAAMRIKDRATREKQLDRMAEELQALKKDAGSAADLIDALRAGRTPGKEMSKRLGDYLLSSLLPSIRNVQRRLDLTEQAQRNLQLALALAAYRHDHGRYPEKPEALAPKYLAEVPDDLFSGKALIYRPTERGYLLYSVGVNGQDEEGHGPEDTPRGDDLAVRMPLPELKRK